MRPKRVKTAEERRKLSELATLRYQDPAEREKLAAPQRGELNHAWKGDDLTYRSSHLRVRKVLVGSPCAHEDATCKGRMECALIHEAEGEHIKTDDRGRRFSPRHEDYKYLCHSHHMRYDYECRKAREATGV